MESANTKKLVFDSKSAYRLAPQENSALEETKTYDSERLLESAPMANHSHAEDGMVTHSNNEAPKEPTNDASAKKDQGKKDIICKDKKKLRQATLMEYGFFSSKKLHRDSNTSVPNLVGLTSLPQGAAGTQMEIQQESRQEEPEEVKDPEQSIPETDERSPASHEERKEAKREGPRTSTDLLGNLPLSQENVSRQRASEEGRIPDAHNEVTNTIKRTRTVIRERTKQDCSKGEKKRK